MYINRVLLAMDIPSTDSLFTIAAYHLKYISSFCQCIDTSSPIFIKNIGGTQVTHVAFNINVDATGYRVSVTLLRNIAYFGIALPGHSVCDWTNLYCQADLLFPQHGSSKLTQADQVLVLNMIKILRHLQKTSDSVKN